MEICFIYQNFFLPCLLTADLSYHLDEQCARNACFLLFILYATSACGKAGAHFQIFLSLPDRFPHALFFSIELSDSISSLILF